MRILADMADVKELQKAFKNNQDIHSLTASQVFDVPINNVSDDFRRKAKAINFGIIYGITQYGACMHSSSLKPRKTPTRSSKSAVSKNESKCLQNPNSVCLIA